VTIQWSDLHRLNFKCPSFICLPTVPTYLKIYIYFDSLALKRLELYLNLLGPFVAYSQRFDLVYK
jgi:hypothetical protein